MDTRKLEKFAQGARRQLHEEVGAKLERVLRTDSAELRAKADAVAELNKQIALSSRESVIERVAYTWFNRFCALRYMDANRYTHMGVVSPAAGFNQPEILQEAKQGHIDEALPVDRQRVFDLLAGRVPSRDAQQEAYRMLLVATCNFYNKSMPFLFEKIDDYTELLMPDDLLSTGSILQETREAMTEEACRDVEVIGWLYQFYISEKKDEVFASKKKIQPEDIPAATQLFTPHWIVRYLVENSLGRLWMLNKPNSRLMEYMDYYIKPEQEEADFLRVDSPEQLTVCDPAAGSGHMLTYAFDLLYAIYEEGGYNPPDIPRLILEKNLIGLEIDERAAALAAFALTMKARAKNRRFLRQSVEPQITCLHPVSIDHDELQRADWFRELGRSLLDLPVQDALLHDLGMMKQIDNIGSLLQPQLTLEQISNLREQISRGSDLFSRVLNANVLDALAQLEPLAKHHYVVVANPPYMGSRKMNDGLRTFAKDNYPVSKVDLYAMFIDRNLNLTQLHGYVAMITMHSWMFLSSFEKMRKELLTRQTIHEMAHLGARAFDTISGEVVSTTAFILEQFSKPVARGGFVRLVDGNSEAQKQRMLLQAIQKTDCEWFYRATSLDFQRIPGSPIAYWTGKKTLDSFALPKLSELADAKQGMATSDNERFLRFWHEVAHKNMAHGCKNLEESESRSEKWYPYNKGGTFRRWYGNNEYVVNWYKNGKELRAFVDEINRLRPGGRLKNQEYYFRENITYSALSSGPFSARYNPQGFLFDTKGSCIFADSESLRSLLALLNSKVAQNFLNILCPTLDYSSIGINAIPVILKSEDLLVEKCIAIAALDWNFHEISWGFDYPAILLPELHEKTLAKTYLALRERWRESVNDLLRLEVENNKSFIDAYDLQSELTAEVELADITLNCNPKYRYGDNHLDEDLESFLRSDTMREFISYAVGCMVGRYSLDKPGLILANQGETVEDYYRIIGLSSVDMQFAPDRDNVLPILDGDWFPDDIVGRFKRFLRVTFGDEHYEENLAFIEDALGRDIRSYFLREFYNHHVKMYKKRPIYWLFSSPNSSFNALIYMHRYRPDTVSIILNDYLRDFRAKLIAQKAHLQQVERSAAPPQRDKTRALKEIVEIEKTLNELREYEDQALYPLATQQIDLDLDDGVKVNYNKFGKALKSVTGLTQK